MISYFPSLSTSATARSAARRAPSVVPFPAVSVPEAVRQLVLPVAASRQKRERPA